MKRNVAVLLAEAVLVISCATLGHAQTLEKFASFPADTFAPGPTSGQFIAPANNRVPPFEGAQPVQGISSVLEARNGDYLVMSDNGFGAKDNSQDYVLRMYRIDPSFRTRRGGAGTIDVRSFITLSDPYQRINFEIVADREFYPGNALVPDNTIPVDEEIRSRRLLTGGDFDIESVREAPDGTFWFGDEFGPFLIHTDSRGRVLWSYHLDSPSNAIGDFTPLSKRRFLVIERDNEQGAAAAFKKIFVVDLNDVDGQGFLVKHLVADLLDIQDPLNIGGQGPVFRFPFQTIESVIRLGDDTLGVLDDNNYPFSSARTPGEPDPNEFIVIKVDEDLLDPDHGHDDD